MPGEVDGLRMEPLNIRSADIDRWGRELCDLLRRGCTLGLSGGQHQLAHGIQKRKPDQR
jgi:hypothetical protein